MHSTGKMDCLTTVIKTEKKYLKITITSMSLYYNTSSMQYMPVYMPVYITIRIVSNIGGTMMLSLCVEWSSFTVKTSSYKHIYVHVIHVKISMN